MLPTGFEADPTFMPVHDMVCPRSCKGRVVQGVVFSETRMILCYGCKICKFKWQAGKHVKVNV